MTAQIINGKAIAENLLNSIKERINNRLALGKRAPGLAVILVGADPASSIYVRNKRLACEKVGIHSVAYDLSISTTEAELLDLIEKLNQDESIDFEDKEKEKDIYSYNDLLSIFIKELLIIVSFINFSFK